MVKDRKKKKLSEGECFQIGSVDAFGVSLGHLLGKAEAPDATHEPAAAQPAKTPRKASALDPNLNTVLAGLQKVTLHRQRAGKGGRTVTVVTLSSGEGIDPEALAKAMRKELGCGSRVENGKVVLQGEIQDRACEWLDKRGVKRVVRGN